MNTDTGVYCITNSVNGKRYIGSTVSFKSRWSDHLCRLRKGNHHSIHLQRAYNKHGESVLVFSKIALCPVTDLLAVEQSRIDALNPEYNVARVAGSRLGVKQGPMSELNRKKIGDAKRGKPLSDAQRKGLGPVYAARRGKKASAETRARLCKAHAGEGNGFYGKKHSAEMRANRTGGKSPVAVSVTCVELDLKFGAAQEAVRWIREKGRETATSAPILKCCRGVPGYPTAYGYRWKFSSD